MLKSLTDIVVEPISPRINIDKNIYTIQSGLQTQCNSHQIPVAFFTELENDPKIHMEKQKTLTKDKEILRKKSKAEDIIIPGVKIYYTKDA
jgi:hypothetical protein